MKTRTNIVTTLVLIGVIASSGTVLQNAYAGTETYPGEFWHIGGEKSISSKVEARVDVNIVTPPASSSVKQKTLYWLGAYSNGGSCGYLTQPELRPSSQQPGKWNLTFETVDLCNNARVEYQPTNVYYSTTDSVYLDDVLLSQGKNFQHASAYNNSLLTGSVTFQSVNYGTSFTKVHTKLEAKDYFGSDFFSAMNTPIQFTNLKLYATVGGTPTTVTLTPYSQASGTHPPPSCITASTGSGSATINASSC